MERGLVHIYRYVYSNWRKYAQIEWAEFISRKHEDTFVWFVDIKMAQIVEIVHRGRRNTIYPI